MEFGRIFVLNLLSVLLITVREQRSPSVDKYAEFLLFGPVSVLKDYFYLYCLEKRNLFLY